MNTKQELNPLVERLEAMAEVHERDGQTDPKWREAMYAEADLYREAAAALRAKVPEEPPTGEGEWPTEADIERACAAFGLSGLTLSHYLQHKYMRRALLAAAPPPPLREQAVPASDDKSPDAGAVLQRHIVTKFRDGSVSVEDITAAPPAPAQVDEDAVERGYQAFIASRGTYEGEVPVNRDDIRAALAAAAKEG